jgi:hypothetical protein
MSGKSRMFGPVIAGFLAFVVLATCLTPAFAATVYTEHENAGGVTRIYLEGQTEKTIILIADHFDNGEFGKADRIQITVGTTSGGYKPVIAYEDNAERCAFLQSLGSVSSGPGFPAFIKLVKPGHIQILRVGKSKTIMVHWNIPLVAPATSNTPEVVLPPGMLVFQGGDTSHPTLPRSSTTTFSAWTLVTQSNIQAYVADVSLFCQDWDYKWKPAPGTMTPYIFTDRTWTWTGS